MISEIHHLRKQVEDFLVNHQFRQYSGLYWEIFAFSGSSVVQINSPFSYAGKLNQCFGMLSSEVPHNLNKTTHLTTLWWFKKTKNINKKTEKPQTTNKHTTPPTITTAKIRALNINEATVPDMKKTVLK